MGVAMVNVWVMRVLVRHFDMHMPVDMRLMTIPRKVVNVLVVNIVRMTVLMVKWFMVMLMLVTLCQMQPDTNRHQSCCNPEQHAC